LLTMVIHWVRAEYHGTLCALPCRLHCDAPASPIHRPCPQREKRAAAPVSLGDARAAPQRRRPAPNRKFRPNPHQRSHPRRGAALSRQCEPTSADQRIDDHQIGEPRKIAIGGPKLPDAVLQTQSRDARVMHFWTRDFAGPQQSSQPFPVHLRLGQKNERRRLDPCVDLVQCARERCRRREYFRMRHDGQEFVDARPRNCPCRATLGKFRHASIRSLMPLRVLAVRVDEDTGVDCDHPPRPS